MRHEKQIVAIMYTLVFVASACGILAFPPSPFGDSAQSILFVLWVTLGSVLAGGSPVLALVIHRRTIRIALSLRVGLYLSVLTGLVPISFVIWLLSARYRH